MRKAATQGSTVASGVVTDPAQGLSENGELLIELLILFYFVLARHCPNSYGAITLETNTFNLGNPININHIFGHNVTKIQHRTKRLAPCQQLGVIEGAEHFKSLVETGGTMVFEGSRFHF